VFLYHQDGFTALTLAAKEGFIEISNMLLEHDAYVNLPDRVLLCVFIHGTFIRDCFIGYWHLIKYKVLESIFRDSNIICICSLAVNCPQCLNGYRTCMARV